MKVSPAKTRPFATAPLWLQERPLYQLAWAIIGAQSPLRVQGKKWREGGAGAYARIIHFCGVITVQRGYVYVRVYTQREETRRMGP